MNFGAVEVTALRLGSVEVSAAFLGDVEVFGGFSPLDLTPAIWLDAALGLYDATSGGSAVADGGAIARWEDQSGNARHLTQVTAGYRPLRDADGGPAGNALVFDGADDTLTRGSLVFDIPCTVFTVQKIVSLTNLESIWDTRSGGSRAGMNERTGGEMRNTSNVPNPGPVQATGEWNIITYRQNLTTTGIQKDDEAEISGALAVTPAGASSFCIGAGANGSTGWSNTAFAEVIAYNRELTVPERAQVVAYLLAKHSLAAVLLYLGAQFIYLGGPLIYSA